MSFLEQERGYQLDGILWWQHEEFTSINQQLGSLSFSIHCTPGPYARPRNYCWKWSGCYRRLSIFRPLWPNRFIRWRSK